VRPGRRDHGARARPARTSARAGCRGFTLIEVRGAILLTSVVVAVAVGFYINLSNASTRAVEMMREQIRATAILDRITRDLSGAMLLAKPEDTDPLNHPWYFTSASRYAFGGADALKFISSSQRPKVSAYHVSDLAQVAYFTSQAQDGTFTLHRWTAPSLPLSFDPEFPGPDAERSFVLAEGLYSVLFRFRSEEGEWVDEWDSTQLVRSGRLPTAVEVSLSIAEGPVDPEAFIDEEPPLFSRRIVLHQRPLDLAQMIEEKRLAAERALAGGGVAGDEDGDGTGGQDGDEDGDAAGGQAMTVAQCVAANMELCQQQFGAQNCNTWLQVSLPLTSFGVSLPWCQ